MRYEYFGPQGQRRSIEYTDSSGYRRIGERIATGFDMWQRFEESPKGELVTIVAFQSEVTGKVWALYYE